MIPSIFDLEKNQNMIWNQGSQLLHLPHETEFFHEIFIFSTSLVVTSGSAGWGCHSLRWSSLGPGGTLSLGSDHKLGPEYTEEAELS